MKYLANAESSHWMQNCSNYLGGVGGVLVDLLEEPRGGFFLLESRIFLHSSFPLHPGNWHDEPMKLSAASIGLVPGLSKASK